MLMYPLLYPGADYMSSIVYRLVMIDRQGSNQRAECEIDNNLPLLVSSLLYIMA